MPPGTPTRPSMPRCLSGASDNVQQADLGDKGTWYRLRIAGFARQGRRLGLVRPAEGGRRRCFLGISADSGNAHARDLWLRRHGAVGRRARVLPRGAALGLHPVRRATSTTPTRCAALVARIARDRGRCQRARADRPGRRPGGAAEAAALACPPAGRALRRAARRRSRKRRAKPPISTPG